MPFKWTLQQLKNEVCCCSRVASINANGTPLDQMASPIAAN